MQQPSTDLLSENYKYLVERSGRIFNSPNGVVKVWLICLGTMLIITSPFFNFRYFDSSYWRSIEEQSRHLFVPIQAGTGLHEDKMVYRLFLPLLASILRIDRTGMYIGQVLCGVGLMLVWIKLAHQILQDHASVLFLSIAASVCYFHFSAYYDVFGRPDAYAYFFLIMAMFCRNVIGISLFACLAAWVDERGLVHSAFVYLFWVWNSKPIHELKVRDYLRPNRYALAVVIAWILYLLGRWILTHYFNFHTATNDIGRFIVLRNSPYIALSTFCTFGGLWLIMFAAAVLLFQRRHIIPLLILLAGFTLSWLIAISVSDINRSLSYLFPLILIALLVIKQMTSVKSVRILLFFACILSVLLPIVIWDGNHHYVPSLPIRLIEVIFMR